MEPLRVAMAQMKVEGGRPAANLERAVAMIDAAAARRCDVVVLPECLDLGWTDASAPRLAEPIPGPRFDVLARAAGECAVTVVAGLVERAGERRFNAAVLVGPDGSLRLLHRKINELDIAHDLYDIGDRLGVARTAFGTVGVDICADNFPDSLAIGHVLARMGARILLSPSAWAVDADYDDAAEPYGAMWEQAFRELARLYDLPVVAVSGVGWLTSGPWRGRRLIGCSLAVGPDGTVLARGPFGEDAEALVVVEVPLRPSAPRGTCVAPALRQRGYTGP